MRYKGARRAQDLPTHSTSRSEKENNKSRSGSSGFCRRYDRLSMGCLRRPALQAHEMVYYPYRSRSRTTRRAKARANVLEYCGYGDKWEREVADGQQTAQQIDYVLHKV